MHRLREKGFSTRLFEAGGGVGGTWYWNRYPGARCDVENPKIPDIKGLDNFKGKYYHTSRWPHEDVSFTGRRVAVIGTGSTGIQCIPIIAEQASHVFVFQRTPNFSTPSRNSPMNMEYEQWWKTNYSEQRRKMREARFGFVSDDIHDRSALSVNPDEREQEYEAQWKIGGQNQSYLHSYEHLLKQAQQAHKNIMHVITVCLIRIDYIIYTSTIINKSTQQLEVCLHLRQITPLCYHNIYMELEKAKPNDINPT
ncbi:unnamed protein product [Rotaria sp. Silwood1]|nr:unnamed protein product [Rotaria sp. Silwood1]